MCFMHSTSERFFMFSNSCSISIQFVSQAIIVERWMTIKNMFNFGWIVNEWKILDGFCGVSTLLELTQIPTRVMLKRALIRPLLCFRCQLVVPLHLLHVLCSRLSGDVTCCDGLPQVVVFLQYQSSVFVGHARLCRIKQKKYSREKNFPAELKIYSAAKLVRQMINVETRSLLVHSPFVSSEINERNPEWNFAHDIASRNGFADQNFLRIDRTRPKRVES